MNWVLSCPALLNLHLRNVLLLMPAPMDDMGLVRVALVVTKVHRSWMTLSTELDPEQVMTMDPAWVMVMVMSRNAESAKFTESNTLPVPVKLMFSPDISRPPHRYPCAGMFHRYVDAAQLMVTAGRVETFPVTAEL